MISKHLQEAINAYKHWLDDGAIEPDFTRHCGLCSTLTKYVGKRFGYEFVVEVHGELKNMFGGSLIPFNDDFDHYVSECDGGECHLNRSRIKWINDHYKVEGNENVQSR